MVVKASATRVDIYDIADRAMVVGGSGCLRRRCVGSAEQKSCLSAGSDRYLTVRNRPPPMRGVCARPS